MPACEEIAMADPDDRMQPEGAPPDGRPRRQPPIIEGEAVEISPGGRPAAASRLSGAWRLVSRLRALLPSWRIVAAVAAGVAAVIVAGGSWIYLADGVGTTQKAAGLEQAPSRDAVGEAAPRTPPAAPDRTADKPAESADLANRLAAVDATLAGLNERIAALEAMVRDTAAAARAAAERADKAARQFADARKSGDEREAAQQLDRDALDDLAGRIKTLESRQMTVRQIQERLDRLAGAAGAPDKVARAVVVAAALRTAVERERPFAAELAAARALGLDAAALGALEPFAATGVPRRNDVFRDLSALLPDLRRAAAPPGQDLGYLDRIQASAARMLNIRPVKDEPGDDPPSVLSRVEFKMVQQQQDVDAIVAELDKLPAAAKELAQPWRTRALARRDALEAARALAMVSLSKLGDAAASGTAPQ
jgi:hypothetical protein